MIIQSGGRMQILGHLWLYSGRDGQYKEAYIRPQVIYINNEIYDTHEMMNHKSPQNYSSTVIYMEVLYCNIYVLLCC